MARPSALESGIRDAQRRLTYISSLLNAAGDEIKSDPELGKKLRKLPEEVILNCGIKVALSSSREIPNLKEKSLFIESLELEVSNIGVGVTDESEEEDTSSEE